MADLSICALEDVIAGATSCEESFSGTASEIFLALVQDLNKADVDIDVDRNRFTPASFESLQGKLFKWDFEEETGEATYESNAGGGGFSNKQELTVRKNMDLISHSLRALNNLKFLAFVPDGKNGYYTYYSAMGSAKLESATGTSGKAASDEHGHTVTISASPMYYPMMKYYPVTADGKPVDLNSWLKSAGQGNKVTLTFSGTGFTVESISGFAIRTTDKVPYGSTIVIKADEGKTLTSVKVAGKDVPVSNNKASFVALADSTITVVVGS